MNKVYINLSYAVHGDVNSSTPTGTWSPVATPTYQVPTLVILLV